VRERRKYVSALIFRVFLNLYHVAILCAQVRESLGELRGSRIDH
jgi:hypothetical protein